MSDFIPLNGWGLDTSPFHADELVVSQILEPTLPGGSLPRQPPPVTAASGARTPAASGWVMTYRASKAAVLHFTKCAAIELAPYDIRVNCLAPGSIPTPILESSAKDLSAEARERFVKSSRQAMRDNRPLERDGTPRDVAEAALYFAGDRSAYVTGRPAR